MAGFSIMKKVDVLALVLLDKFKEQPVYLKIVDEYNILEEWQQGLVKSILMFLTVSIPLFFVLVSFLFYSSKKAELERYENIIEYSATIIEQSKQMSLNSNATFGADISTEGLLSSRINTISSSTGVDTNSFKISNYDLIEDNGINEVRADLNFSNLSDQNLFSFLRRFIFTEKFKVRSIQIKKDNNSKLLNGIIGMAYFSKISVSDDE